MGVACSGDATKDEYTEAGEDHAVWCVFEDENVMWMDKKSFENLDGAQTVLSYNISGMKRREDRRWWRFRNSA